MTQRGLLPECGSQSPVVPHGSVDCANRWETVPWQPQSTRRGPEAAPSSVIDLLVSYRPLAPRAVSPQQARRSAVYMCSFRRQRLLQTCRYKITQRHGARTSSTAVAPGHTPGTHPTSSRFRTWPRARGTRGRGTAASSSAGRTSRMSRTRSTSSPPLRLRARSFHPAIGTGRGRRTVVAPPAEAPARPREPGYVECRAEGLR